MPQRELDTVREIFDEAITRSPDERDAYIDAASDDPTIRQEVRSLLRSYDTTGDFLQTPPLGDAIGVDEVARWASPDEALLGERIGGFRLTRVIAAGGMGTVFEAEQDQPRRTVALKLMRQGLTSHSALRRFEYESQILARLRHPSITRVLAAGTHDSAGGVPYFAMELVRDSKTITDHARAQRLSVRDKLQLFERICQAVHHGHLNGVVHRDLKPANILVDGDGEVKIIDFGVARATDSDIAITTLQTDVGQLIGTIQYMSPEQCAGVSDDIDARSDVYSLGVVLYELLCDRLPYDVSEVPLQEGMRIVREQAPTKLSTFSRALRGDLETIVMKAMQKERERRYDSAAALAADIRHYLNDEPVVARPASAIYQLRKFARRNRAVFGGVVVALVVLIAATVVSTIFAVRESRAAQQARTESLKAHHIAEFLHDMLAGVDPSVAQGADTQLLQQILDKTSKRIETDLAGLPEVEAAIRATLGNTYSSLSLHELAEPHLTRSLELREEQLGAEHEDTLAAVQNLAYHHFNLGQFDKAEPLYVRALEGQRRILGQDHPATLLSLSHMGSIYMLQDRLDEAEANYVETLQGYRRSCGEEHVETLRAMNNLAALYFSRRKFEESSKQFAELLEIDKRVLGEGHVSTLTVMFNLAASYRMLGQLVEAEPLYRQTLEIRQRVLGPNHQDTLGSMGALGDLYRKMERFDEAEALLDKTVRTARASMPQGHWFIGLFVGKYGRLMYDLKRYADAEVALLEAYEINATTFGANNGRTTSVGRSLIDLYEAWGKPDEAAAWLEKLSESVDDAAPDS